MLMEILAKPTNWLRKVCKLRAAWMTGTARHLVYLFWAASLSCREAWAKRFLFWSKALPYTVSWETRLVRRARSTGYLLIILIWNVQRRLPAKVLDCVVSWATWRVLHPS